MSSENILTIGEQADSLMEMRTSLKELLGDDWKERSIYQSFDDAFSKQEIEAIKNRKVFSVEDARTPLETFSAELNNVFKSKNSTYECSVIENQDGKKDMFILGKIGQDYIYQVVDLEATNQKTNSESFVWSPKSWGIVSENGETFKIDPLYKIEGEDIRKSSDMVFIVKRRGEYTDNMHVSGGVDGTITILPETYQDIGVVMHELGHLLRNKLIDKKGLDGAFSASYSGFEKISKTHSTSNPGAKLTNYQTRVIEAQDERGAWAVGLSILREVGNSTGIESGSLKSIREIVKRAEGSLSTYDSVSYTLAEQPGGNEIPTFSQRSRKDARSLHKKVTGMGLKYSDLPSFDERTGENIANNPEKINRLIDEEWQ